MQPDCVYMQFPMTYRIAGYFRGRKFSLNGSRALRRQFRGCNICILFQCYKPPISFACEILNTGAREFLPVFIYVLTALPSKKRDNLHSGKISRYTVIQGTAVIFATKCGDLFFAKP